MGDIEGQSVKDYKQEGPIVDAQEKKHPIRQKINKKIIIAILASIILIAIVAAVIIMNKTNNNNQSGNSNDNNNQATIADPVEGFDTIDIESEDADAYVVEESMDTIFGTTAIWDGCIEGGELKADCAIDNIDRITEFYNITDERKLQMVDIQKAIVYTTVGDYERAWVILQNYNEENLVASQLRLYYSAMYGYYNAIGDEGNKNHYYEKLLSVSLEAME